MGPETRPDWVAYVVVFGVTIATIIGKILISKGDTKNDKPKDN